MGKDNAEDGGWNSNALAKAIGGSLETSFKAGPQVFDKPLYAGLGNTTNSAIQSLINASNAPNGFGAATQYNTDLLQNGGLTSGMQGNLQTANSIGNSFDTLADRLRGTSSATTGLNSLAGQFGGIAGGLTGPSAAQTGTGNIANQYGQMANSLNGPSAAQTGLTGLSSQYGGLANSLSNPSAAQRGWGNISGQFGDMAQGLDGRSGADRTLGGITNQFGNMASGLTGQSAAQRGFTGLYNDAGDKSLTERELMGAARGDYLNGANPYFEDVLKRTLGDVSTAGQAAYGASGRYGSNVAAEGIGQAIGDVSSQARLANYNNERDRQIQALGAIEGQRQQGFSNQFNSLGAADQTRLAQLGARTGALQNQAGSAQAQDAARLAQLNAQSGALTNQGNALSQADQARMGQLNARLAAMSGQAGTLNQADAARLNQLGARGNALTGQLNAYGANDAARLNQLNARSNAMLNQGNLIGAGDQARLNQIGAYGNALNSQLGANQNSFAMGQQGVSNASQAGLNAGALYQQSLQPGQTQLGLGQLQDANSQASLLAQNDLFRRQNDAQRDWAASYIGMLNPNSVQGGEEVPWWQQALGYIAGNAGQAIGHLGGN